MDLADQVGIQTDDRGSSEQGQVHYPEDICIIVFERTRPANESGEQQSEYQRPPKIP